MRIVFHSDATRPEPWLAALRQALPQAEVSTWAEGAPAADYAVVWAPPQRLFDEQGTLKAAFNLGAGVDALLPRIDGLLPRVALRILHGCPHLKLAHPHIHVMQEIDQCA